MNVHPRRGGRAAAAAAAIELPNSEESLQAAVASPDDAEDFLVDVQEIARFSAVESEIGDTVSCEGYCGHGVASGLKNDGCYGLLQRPFADFESELDGFVEFWRG